MSKEVKDITISEFYEKHIRVNLPNGETVHPKLSDEERILLDTAQELNEPPYVRVFTRIGGYQYLANPKITEYLKQLR